jgi:chromosome segregation ATPase
MPGMGPGNGGYFGGKPAALDIPKANALQTNGLHSPFYIPGTPGMPSSPPISSTHAADLEQELRELSTELANSLRREMELEDELETMKLRSETTSNTLNAERRTSDYFSDSGAGSVRYPGDGDGKIEQLERLRRAAEQEKAQLKIRMSDKLQDALNQRREAEERSLVLHERLKSAGIGEMNSQNPAELKLQIEEMRRKLSEESQFRQNFQDLVGGMRVELEQIKNERDNLRDEIVPSLRSRLEGLETDNANNQSMTYEHTRMSQELQTLRNENQTLLNARRMQMEMQQQGVRFTSIEEDGSPPTPSSPSLGGLSRSKSFAVRGGRSSRTNSIIGTSSLTRATSVKDPNKTFESREVLTQKVKDAEIQRDALHKALKSLLERHLVQEKKHAKKVQQMEKDLLTAETLTPRRTVFHEEVKQLRDEVHTLRRRADDALDQKWQLEKNFSGVKMDLDRAKEETGGLRSLLDRRDMFLPDRPGSRDGTKALDRAYKELRTTHALSIAHLKDIESSMGYTNGEAQKTLELLKQSISDAEAERDGAQSQAAAYREQARNLQKSELDHLSKEQNLSAELYASAQRMDDLANQVQSQIQSNSVLRGKLAEAIERGEREQKNSTTKIADMQSRLRDLEDKLVYAQQQSEQIVSTHEQEVNQLKEAHNAQLQRSKSALLPPGSATLPTTPMSALFAPKSPIKRVSMADATKTNSLESKVRELERALNDAEQEMGEVVSRMNMAQMEVAELQSER